MRLSSIVSEAVRNITSGASRTIIWFLALAVASTLFGGFEALTIIGQESTAAARIESAADVTTIVSPVSAIDGAVCDRLTEAQGGPSASGAMRESEQITPRSTPGRSIGSYEVTAGMIRLLALSSVSSASAAANAGHGSPSSSFPASSGQTSSSANQPAADASGIWVSTALAHDFGWAKGSLLETDHGDIPVAGVFDWPNDGRDTRFVYALIVPVSSSAKPFAECWAKQWPQTEALDLLLNETAISGVADANTLPGVTQLNKSHDRRYSADSLYETRMTRVLPVAALAVGVVIGIAAVRRRRLEYAGALHCGQRKGAQLLTALCEMLITSGAAIAVTLPLLAALCWRLSPSDPAVVFLAAARSPATMLSGALVATALAVLAVRESRLFRLFKAR
ncbi:hypothetical protein BW14_11080 [Bifidobacterium sp. UTBIF-68]|uniref:hypothetical protein n=1 Tax=Bifidobacterium sp. UTBIF-68 TaxID=1465262 RepID=UPI00112B6B78|nr:hypothetical protein [Bifidobacterium sp. UTBIF-68]TPF91861.1 hypothetical protein BW14_11080 [Bifidobacterium sp. UTBIF-68]